MSKKLILGTLFHRPPLTEARQTREQAEKEQAAESARLARELKAAEIETRFREALASGRITGDVITTDESGNVVHPSQSTNIFDL